MLEPVKFKPLPPLDPRQEALDSSEEETAFIAAQVAGVCIASASSSTQSLEAPKNPAMLGRAAAPKCRGHPVGSRYQRRDPVVDLEAPPVVATPKKLPVAMQHGPRRPQIGS